MAGFVLSLGGTANSGFSGVRSYAGRGAENLNPLNPLFAVPALKEIQRKSHPDDIIVAGSRYLRKLDSTRVQLGQGSPHFRRDDLVCFAVKDANLRDLILRENRFQRNQVVEPVPEKAPKRDADLCSDHIVHGGEGRKHQNFADGVFGCELEGGSPSKRVSEDAQSTGVKFPMLLFQKSLERTFRVLQDRLRIWSSFTKSVAWVVDQ